MYLGLVVFLILVGLGGRVFRICLARCSEAFEIPGQGKLRRVLSLAYSSFQFVACCSITGVLKYIERERHELLNLFEFCRPPTDFPLKILNPSIVNLRLLTLWCFLIIFHGTSLKVIQGLLSPVDWKLEITGLGSSTTKLEKLLFHF